MPNRDEILATVTEVMVDALGVDPEDVTGEASLVADLGAESIDFLDIIFRLEKAFNVKVPREELFPENLTGNPNFVKDGVLTPEGVATLKAKMPYADMSKFEADPKVSSLVDLFTVGMIVRYLDKKLNG